MSVSIERNNLELSEPVFEALPAGSRALLATLARRWADSAIVISHLTEPSVLRVHVVAGGRWTDAGIRSSIGVPLETHTGTSVGSLCAIAAKPDRYDESDLRLLQVVARLLADDLDCNSAA